MTDRQCLSVCLSVSSMSNVKTLIKTHHFNGNDVTKPLCNNPNADNSSSSAFPFMQTESPWTDADAGMRSRPASPSVLSDGILSFRAAQVVYAHISLCPPHPLPTLPTHYPHYPHCPLPTVCPRALRCSRASPRAAYLRTWPPHPSPASRSTLTVQPCPRGTTCMDYLRTRRW